MGCPCREIRRAIARWVPGGKHLVGLLPDFPPEKGSEAMKMLAPVAGQAFHLVTGNSYYADEHRVIHDVDIHDVSQLRGVGCTILEPQQKTVVDTATAYDGGTETHAQQHAFEDAPEAAAEHDPATMPGEEPAAQ